MSETSARIGKLLKPVECDGACGVHHYGEIRRVQVSWPTSNGFKDWGVFRYCEYAIKQDRQNGFIVEVIE